MSDKGIIILKCKAFLQINIILTSIKNDRAYIHAYLMNLEEWYWWTYLQGRNRDADIKTRLGMAGTEGGANWESSSETYTLPYINQIANGKFCITQGAQCGSLWQSRGEGWGGGW